MHTSHLIQAAILATTSACTGVMATVGDGGTNDADVENDARVVEGDAGGADAPPVVPFECDPGPEVDATTIDGIDYTESGGYADLDFCTLVARYGGGYQGSPGVPGPPGVAPPPSTYEGWRLGRVGPRWVFVTPDGKVFLLRGLYKVSYDQPHAIGGGAQAGRTLSGNIVAKYAGDSFAWEAATAARLRAFHYNSTASASRYLGDDGLAFQAQYNTGAYTLSGGFGFLSEAVKDIARDGVRQNLPGANGWQGRTLIDAFDPKFREYIDNPDGNGWGGITPNPDVIFFQADDGDYMFFFGSGHPDETGAEPHDAGWAPHGGMVALIGNPTITGPITDIRGGTQTWTIDTLNHTKRALLDMLIERYRSIDALNDAWDTGGYYTSFESDGGWGVGTGLADEDGMRPRPWFGMNGAPFYQKLEGQNDFFNSTRWNPNVKIDLDIFLGMMVDAYLRPFAERLQIRYPGALFIGHTGAGARNGLARTPVLESYGRWLHLVRAHGLSAPDATNASERERMGRDIPVVSALYFPNNDDSSMYYIARGDGTQAERGANIAMLLIAGMSYRDEDGIYPVVGTNFWGLYDQPGERIGWGIFSYNDNPYDGTDYTSPRPDPYTEGRTTLTEDRVYGDVITPIRNAHAAQYEMLRAQLGEAP